MIRGLQIFPDAIPQDLPAIRAMGIRLVRLAHAGDRPDLVHHVIDAGLRVLVTVDRADQIKAMPDRIDIELGNEPDIASNGWTVQRYIAEAAAAIPICEAKGCMFWAGAISNLHRKGFEFLRALPWQQAPAWCGCSIHRYPENTGPLMPHYGFASRAAEIAELRRIVGPRKLACSEVGYHDGKHWSEADVASAMRFERMFFEAQGFELISAYQLNDGPLGDLSDDGHYGFGRSDGTWKPVVAAWTSNI